MNSMMRATAILGPKSSSIIEVPRPRLSPDQILVRVTAAGVCASERPLWEHHGGGDPILLGHEFAGVVEEAGSATFGWRLGDRVTGFANNTFAEYIVADPQDLFALPDHVPDIAGLGEPLACVMEAVGRSGIQPGARVAVVGVGFMGQIAIQAIRAAGASEIVAVDLRESLFPLARRLGATSAFSTDSIVESEPASFNVVIELTGTAEGLRVAGALVSVHGTLCVAGYHHDGERKLDVQWWYRGITVINGFSPSRERQRQALRAGLELVQQRRMTLEPLITHVFGLDELDSAYAPRQQDGAAKIKSVLIP